MQLLLSCEGYETIEASNGEEVLSRLDETVDLVILDVMMGFSVGGDDYLVKPFSCNELINRVKALLRCYYVYGAKRSEETRLIRCCGNLEIDPDQCLVRQNGKDQDTRLFP